jgi:hypothetical protein
MREGRGRGDEGGEGERGKGVRLQRGGKQDYSLCRWKLCIFSAAARMDGLL